MLCNQRRRIREDRRRHPAARQREGEEPKEGKVVAIGTGKTLDNGQRSTFSVKVGDRVLFTSYAGTEVKAVGTEYLVMREDDILGVIED